MTPIDPQARIIVHGGWTKTGTTFLQQQVFPHLPVSYIGGAHLRYVHLQSFREQENPNILISDETLLGTEISHRVIDREEAKQNFLHAWRKISPHTQFIACIREHKPYVNSLYSQYLCLGGTRPPQDFISTTGERGDKMYVLSDLMYYPCIRTIKDLFPGPHFIFNYEDLAKKPKETVQALSEFIVGGPVQLDEGIFERTRNKRVNTAVAEAHVTWLRLANRITHTRPAQARRWARPVTQTAGRMARRMSKNLPKPQFIKDDGWITSEIREDWEKSLAECVQIG